MAKRIIIVGGTSGIGKETALLYIRAGWTVGIAGRREPLLRELQQLAPERVHVQVLDVCLEDAPQRLGQLIQRTGGMDVYLHSSGIGHQNPALDASVEVATTQTNVTGFTRMVDAAFLYFKQQRQPGQIAAISSIAGTKGLGIAPAYSATKRFQNTYLQCLSQLAHMQGLPIAFTDIRPGFVDTDLLKNARFPLLMQPDKVARQIEAAIRRKRRVCVIDWKYRLVVGLWKLIPSWLWERLAVK